MRISFALALGLLVAGALATGAAGKAGDIYIGNDGESDSVVRIKPGSGAQRLIASGSPLDSPSGMGFAPNGRLYVADYELPGIARVNTRTGAAVDLASGPPFYSEPLDVERGPDGFLYVAEEGGANQGILRVNPRNGNTTSFVDNTDLVNDPYALTIRHSDGSIFVADGGDGEVIRVSRTGDQELVSDDPDLGTPQGIALSPGGKLFVGNGSDSVVRVNIATGVAEVVATDPLLSGLYNIDFEPRGTVVAAALSADAVSRVNVGTGSVTPVSDGDLITSPEGIAVEPPECGGELATIVGSTRKDRIKGSKFDDVIATLGGRDGVRAGRGDDVVCGGGARDTLKGQAGDDELLGEAGADRCGGGPGRDRERSC